MIALRRTQFVASGLFLLFLCWANTHKLDLYAAWLGYSPMASVYQQFEPEHFARDFSSGSGGFGKNESLFMYTYTVAYRFLDILPETLMPFVASAQIVFLALAIWRLCRVLRPNAPHAVSLAVIILSLASYARDLSIGNYAQPMPPIELTMYYYIADVLLFLCLSEFIHKRYVISAIWLSLAYATYPRIGVFGMVFIGAGLLLNPKELVSRKTIASMIIFCGSVVYWTITRLSGSMGSYSEVSEKMWFELMEMGSAHLFTVAFGYFSHLAWRGILPFFFFMVLFCYYFPRISSRTETDRRMLAGIIAMILLTFIGIILSIIKPNPQLVLIGLNRANELAVMIGLIYIVEGLWRDITSPNVLTAGAAMGVLICPFIFRSGYIPLYSAIIAFPAVWASVRGKWKENGNGLTALLWLSTSGLALWYYVQGMHPNRQPWEPFIGSAIVAGWSIAWMLVNHFSPMMRPAGRWIQWKHAVIFFILMGFGVNWNVDHRIKRYSSLTPKRMAMADDYKKAQQWAKQNTRADALFMPDPTMNYSWKDYSHRSSFGTIREWIFLAWLYAPKQAYCEEGLRRFGEFGLSLENYTASNLRHKGWSRLVRDLGDRYYQFSDAKRKALADKYGIDYFVLLREKTLVPSEFPIAFENSHFIILYIPADGNCEQLSIKQT